MQLDTRLHNLKGSFLSDSVMHSCLQEMGKITRLALMIIRYLVLFFEVSVKRYCWFLSSLPWKFLKLSSVNIAQFSALKICLHSAITPISKHALKRIGRAQGLRATQDLTYLPASGICLGMSLSFLSQLFLQKRGEDPLIFSAKKMRSGGTEMSVKIQSIYEMLISSGKVDQELFLSLCRLLQRKEFVEAGCKSTELVQSVKNYLSASQKTNFHTFIFDDLEQNGVKITPSIYALVLELEAALLSSFSPDQGKYDFIHCLIIEAVSDILQLKSAHVMRFQEKVEMVSDKLSHWPEGHFLFHFSNHTVAFVKEKDRVAIFDPKSGLAVASLCDQKELFSHILKFYGDRHQLVNLRISSIKTTP